MRIKISWSGKLTIETIVLGAVIGCIITAAVVWTTSQSGESLDEVSGEVTLKTGIISGGFNYNVTITGYPGSLFVSDVDPGFSVGDNVVMQVDMLRVEKMLVDVGRIISWQYSSSLPCQVYGGCVKVTPTDAVPIENCEFAHTGRAVEDLR